MGARYKEQVIEISNLIPGGCVTSYGAIAKPFGFTNQTRQVGNTFRGEKKSYPANDRLDFSTSGFNIKVIRN